MKINKSLVVLYAALAAFALCACSTKTESTSQSVNTESVAVSEAVSDETSAVAAEETAETAVSAETSTSESTEAVSSQSDAADIPEADYHAENEYMELAIAEAREGIYNNHGGPFGSVIVRDGKIIGQGHNMVLKNNDSTCHGEISAIRNAESSLATFDLTGAVLYTTGEPCPMCLAACMWANIDKVYYGCTIEDNEMIGFRDKKFDEMFGGREAFAEYLEELDRDACLKLFDEYNAMDAQNY